MNPEIYKQLLENESFLNDCWNSHDTTTKIEILTKVGWDLENEWKRHMANLTEPTGDEDKDVEERAFEGTDHDSRLIPVADRNEI